jgi:heme/copper-type cytochrome/quinol oxidase subunit 2
METPRLMMIVVVIVVVVAAVFAFRSCSVKQKSDDNKSSLKFELEKNKDR